MESFGNSLFNTGKQLQDGWNKQEDANAYSGYLAFKAKQDLGYKDTVDKLQPGEAQGFTGRVGGAFGEAAKGFLDTLPERLRQSYGDRLGVDALARIQHAQGVEKTEQVRRANATLDTTIDQHLMPRVEAAATIPGDDPTKFPALQQAIADGDAAIDANPALTPIEKATAKQKWHQKAQEGFANALPSREKATMDPNSAGTELGDTPIWGKVLDAVPYASKLAITQDGYRAYLQERTAQQAAQRAADTARYNAYENAVRDNKFGLADVQSAYNSGQLNDADERGKLIGLITERDKEGLNLAAVSQKIDPASGYKFNPFDPNDKKAVNLFYDKGIAQGGKTLLEPSPPSDPSAPAPQTQTPQDMLAAVVRRTGMVPDSAVNEIQGGIYSPDPQMQERGFTLMDAIARANPAAYFKAFSPEDRKRLDIYQALAPLVPPDVLAERLAPLTPQAADERDRMEKIGRDEATKNYQDIGKVIAGAYGSWGQGWFNFLPGQPGTPIDPGVVASFRKDFEDAYTTAYGTVRNSHAAEQLAYKWLKGKWGSTDVGSGDNTLMAYPPERYYNAIDGNHHWMDEQIEASVKATYPKAVSWGVKESEQTQTEIAIGRSPSYYVWFTDDTGGFRWATDAMGSPVPVTFDYDKARQTALDKFNEKRAILNDPGAQQLRDIHSGDAATQSMTVPPDNPGTTVDQRTQELQQIHEGQPFGTGDPLMDKAVEQAISRLKASGLSQDQIDKASEELWKLGGKPPDTTTMNVPRAGGASRGIPQSGVIAPSRQPQSHGLFPGENNVPDQKEWLGVPDKGFVTDERGVQIADASGAIPQSAVDRFTADEFQAQQSARAKEANPIAYFMNSPVIKAFRRGWESVPPTDPHVALFNEFFGGADPGKLTSADVRRAYDNAITHGRYGDFAQVIQFMMDVTKPILAASEPRGTGKK